MNSVPALVTCKTCGYFLPVNEAIKYKNYYFHPTHFKCAACETPLLGKPYYVTQKEDFSCDFLCEKDYFGNQKQKRQDLNVVKEGPITGELCLNCNQSLKGSPFVSVNLKKFHKECFYCSHCKCAFGAKGMFESQKDIICENCLEKLKNQSNGNAGPTKQFRGSTVPNSTPQNQEQPSLNYPSNNNIKANNPQTHIFNGQNMLFSTVEERFTAERGQKVTGSAFLNKLRENLMNDKDQEICNICGNVIVEIEKVHFHGAYFHVKCYAEKKRSNGSEIKKERQSLEAAKAKTPGFNPNYSSLFWESSIKESPSRNDTVTAELSVQEGNKCLFCQEVFRQGEKFILLNQLYLFHERCFFCQQCNIRLNYDMFYVTRDLVILCLPCSDKRNKERNKNIISHENINITEGEKYNSQRSGENFTPNIEIKGKAEVEETCGKCKKKIVGDGIKIFGQVIHQDCFTCSKCKRICIKEFFYKNQECFCTECYREQLEICCVCQMPITNNALKKDGLLLHPECLEGNLRSNLLNENEVKPFRSSGLRPKLEILTQEQSIKMPKQESLENEDKDEVTTPGFAKKPNFENVLESTEISEKQNPEYFYDNKFKENKMWGLEYEKEDLNMILNRITIHKSKENLVFEDKKSDHPASDDDINLDIYSKPTLTPKHE